MPSHVTSPFDEIKDELRLLRDDLTKDHEHTMPSQTLKEIIADCMSAIVVDMETGVIVEATAIVEALFGYIPGELPGKTIHDLVPEEIREQHKLHFARFRSHPVPRQMGASGMKLAGVKRDGTTFPLEIGLYPRALGGKRYVVATIMPMRFDQGGA